MRALIDLAGCLDDLATSCRGQPYCCCDLADAISALGELDDTSITFSPRGQLHGISDHTLNAASCTFVMALRVTFTFDSESE